MVQWVMALEPMPWMEQQTHHSGLIATADVLLIPQILLPPCLLATAQLFAAFSARQPSQPNYQGLRMQET
jgi:hypothetical protein